MRKIEETHNESHTLANETSHAPVAEESRADTAHEEHLKHSNSLFAEPVLMVQGIPITNAMLTSWIAVFVIIILSVALRTKMKAIPGKLQHIFEVIIEGGLDLCDQVTGSRKLSLKIFPITVSLFFFILINNWLGILPITAIGINEHNTFIPFIRSGTADLNTTLALGLVAVIGSNLFGIVSLGIWKTFNKYINLNALKSIATSIRKDWTVIIVAPIQFFVGIIEIIGEIAKIASLSFRLFGNVFAGEILLVSMSALIAYIVPLPFLFLEVLVGLIQALIFSMLTLVYFTIASHDHGNEEHGEHEDAPMSAEMKHV